MKPRGRQAEGGLAKIMRGRGGLATYLALVFLREAAPASRKDAPYGTAMHIPLRREPRGK